MSHFAVWELWERAWRGVCSELDLKFQCSDRTAARAQELVRDGARAAPAPAEAAENADFIIAMVADDDASREVWTGTNGALKTARRDAILIDSSTITPNGCANWLRSPKRTAVRCSMRR